MGIAMKGWGKERGGRVRAKGVGVSEKRSSEFRCERSPPAG